MKVKEQNLDMFILALFIGIYSYFIFALGVVGLLTKINIIWSTIVWFILLIFFERKPFFVLYKKVYTARFHFKIKKIHKNIVFLFVILFILQAFVNLIGALGPELAFDALWYHLTLPKLYLLHHAIYHIPGGLLYYSDMPKLGEMLYTGALAFGNEITAKLIHFSFSILVSLVLYKFSRKFFLPLISALVIVIFYSNLVVDWESTTAYIDLIRTFLEVLALWGFINWFESKRLKWLVLSALMMGLAITTKVLALGSLVIFSLFILYFCFDSYVKTKRFTLKALISFPVYLLISLLVPLPWFIFSYIHTGNPVYPFFTHTYEVSASSPNPLKFIFDLWNLFTHASDPISPIYLIFLPLIFVTYAKFTKEVKMIVWYCGLSLILWYFTPQTGGGRFILPYLPAFSLVCGAIYSEILKKARIEWKYIPKLLIFTIAVVSIISIGYRFVANYKFLPVLIGKESKSKFLSTHLNFSYGDFYDTDNYFATHIKSSDTVLLYGFHNLYYVNFPFIDNSWAKKGNTFTYIALQKTVLPTRFSNWQLVYSNDKTMVQLYRPPKGECDKACEY